MLQPSFLMFCLFVAITLVITFRVSHRVQNRGGFYAAGQNVSGIQNGFAFAGDYMSASTFLGIAGLYVTTGLDGFIYSVGSVVGWPLLLFLFAERLRTLGRYTLTDVLAQRFADRSVRLFSAIATMVVLTFYMISQLVGAGGLVELLLDVDFVWSVLVVGGLMVVYVTFGGMVATT
ncbi:MAG: cation acetate symporter, partial [Alphaproteobacteria bacterium]|nr:cation acetate symporter [Alphaproteobacteria bacterium]